jgi:putative chitinase
MSNQLVDIRKVPTFYRGLPWQRKALKYLDTTLSFDQRTRFTQLWRSGWHDVLTEIVGREVWKERGDDLAYCFGWFEIKDPLEQAHFIAQTAHETGGYRWFLELASGEAYENRKDLGNTQVGDGPKYKGAGAVQLTGRANYKEFGDFIGDSEVLERGAEYVATKYPFTSAGFWWNQNVSPYLRTSTTCREVSRWVNGRDPANGLEERERYFQKALEVLMP